MQVVPNCVRPDYTEPAIADEEVWSQETGTSALALPNVIPEKKHDIPQHTMTYHNIA